MLHVDFIEAVWIGLNGVCLVVTIIAFIDSLRDRSAVRRLNGRARKLVVDGNVRREILRVIVQVLLIVVVVPGIFVDTPVKVTPLLVIFMAVPVVLLVSSLFDWRDRRNLNRLVDEVAAQRQTA